MKKIYSYSLSAAFVVALLSVSSVANAQDNSAAVAAEASQDAAVATWSSIMDIIRMKVNGRQHR